MSVSHSSGGVHRELALEEHLLTHLVRQQGYVERSPEDYDRASALDKELVLRFLRNTQVDDWARLEAHYGMSAESELFRQLERALQQRGTVDVLRHGLKLVPGIHFRLCAFRPASNLNPELMRRYEANILSAIRQVHYSLKNENAIDVVLFFNGIPTATLELKNKLTGTTFRHAEQQYKTDRSPAGEPLLTMRRGAVVHFAVDEDYVTMTTRLRHGRTDFLPFNRGREGGAGNPDVPGEYRIAYLYADLPEGKAVFSREVWMDVIGNFLHLEKEEGSREGKLIFPRFHQLEAVRRIMGHARRSGSGQHYLIQHSTGSGKSNTIAWTAHHAIKLHDEEDRPVFNTVRIPMQAEH